MSALQPAVVDRLIKCLGMLGSDHDGERASAGRMAHNLLAEHGVTWADVVGQRETVVAKPLGGEPVNPWQPRQRGPQPATLLRAHQREAMLLLASGFAWDEWKQTFLASIRSRKSELTDGQRDKLAECRCMADEWREARSAA